MSFSLLLADVVTKESAGAAGMVGILLGLIQLTKMLIAKQNGKNGKCVATIADVKALFVQFKNPSAEEKIARDKTRFELHELHNWAEEERADQKQSTKEYSLIANEVLRLIREIAASNKEIGAAVTKTLDLHLPVDQNNVPLWYVPREWGEKQNKILEQLSKLNTGLNKRGTV